MHVAGSAVQHAYYTEATLDSGGILVVQNYCFHESQDLLLFKPLAHDL